MSPLSLPPASLVDQPHLLDLSPASFRLKQPKAALLSSSLDYSDLRDLRLKREDRGDRGDTWDYPGMKEKFPFLAHSINISKNGSKLSLNFFS